MPTTSSVLLGKLVGICREHQGLLRWTNVSWADSSEVYSASALSASLPALRMSLFCPEKATGHRIQRVTVRAFVRGIRSPLVGDQFGSARISRGDVTAYGGTSLAPSPALVTMGLPSLGRWNHRVRACRGSLLQGIRTVRGVGFPLVEAVTNLVSVSVVQVTSTSTVAPL
jgi:hypothetical protein